MIALSAHAERRARQRGVTQRDLALLLDHADIDVPVGAAAPTDAGGSAMSEGETTGNIIRPPAFRGSTARERRAHVEKQRKQAEEQRGRELSRLRAIEKAPARGKKGPVFKKLGDRLIAARANGELVDRARQEKGVSIQEIEKRFGGRRSDRYRLAPGADVATREARKKAGRRLMQQVRGYLRLAEAVAGLTGENADDLKLDVLKQTSLWSSPPRSRGEDAGDERAERLALLIHAMAKHVIREARLVDLFEKLRRIPAGWHGWETDNQESSPWEIEDVRAPGDGWGTDSQEFGPDCCACLGPGGYENSSSPFYPLPFPSVGLARLPSAELPVSVFSGERTEVDENDGFRGTLLLSRELRLVIGPTTSAARPGPMFESRPYVHLHGRGESYFLSQNPLEHLVFGTKDECFEGSGGSWRFDGKYWEFSRKNPWGESSKGDERTEDDDGLWANVFLKRKADDGGTSPMLHLKAMGRVRLNDDVCDPEWSDVANFQRLYWRRVPGVPATRREGQPPSQHPPQWGEHWREVAWKPLDAAHVSGMLDGPSPLFQLGHLPPFLGEFVECWFPGEESLVYNVERRLVTGDLERVLLATSERIRRALDRYVREWRGRLEARDARLIAGWSAGADEET